MKKLVFLWVKPPHRGPRVPSSKSTLFHIVARGSEETLCNREHDWWMTAAEVEGRAGGAGGPNECRTCLKRYRELVSR